MCEHGVLTCHWGSSRWWGCTWWNSWPTTWWPGRPAGWTSWRRDLGWCKAGGRRYGRAASRWQRYTRPRSSFSPPGERARQAGPWACPSVGWLLSPPHHCAAWVGREVFTMLSSKAAGRPLTLGLKDPGYSSLPVTQDYHHRYHEGLVRNRRLLDLSVLAI